jgi:hypothetical protein
VFVRVCVCVCVRMCIRLCLYVHGTEGVAGTGGGQVRTLLFTFCELCTACARFLSPSPHHHFSLQGASQEEGQGARREAVGVAQAPLESLLDLDAALGEEGVGGQPLMFAHT